MESMETLIKRAANALSFVDEAEVMETFVAEGIEPSVAFLAIKAGVSYLKLNDKDEELGS